MANATAQQKLDRYPTLTEMGVVRPQEISHYSLHQAGPNKDVLRIYYKRAKGSLLPFSRKYLFGRSMKTVVADGGTSTFQDTYEISPYLQRAMAELDNLVAENKLEKPELREQKESVERKAAVLVDLNHIERVFGEQLDAEAKASVAAKFDAIRKQLELV